MPPPFSLFARSSPWLLGVLIELLLAMLLSMVLPGAALLPACAVLLLVSGRALAHSQVSSQRAAIGLYQALGGSRAALLGRAGLQAGGLFALPVLGLALLDGRARMMLPFGVAALLNGLQTAALVARVPQRGGAAHQQLGLLSRLYAGVPVSVRRPAPSTAPWQVSHVAWLLAIVFLWLDKRMPVPAGDDALAVDPADPEADVAHLVAHDSTAPASKPTPVGLDRAHDLVAIAPVNVIGRTGPPPSKPLESAFAAGQERKLPLPAAPHDSALISLDAARYLGPAPSPAPLAVRGVDPHSLAPPRDAALELPKLPTLAPQTIALAAVDATPLSAEAIATAMSHPVAELTTSALLDAPSLAVLKALKVDSLASLQQVPMDTHAAEPAPAPSVQHPVELVGVSTSGVLPTALHSTSHG